MSKMSHPRFAVLDVERANDDLGSVCLVGLVLSNGIGRTEEHRLVVNPQGPVSDWVRNNVQLNQAELNAARPWYKVASVLEGLLDGVAYVAAHSAADRRALNAAYERMGRMLPLWEWVDTVQVANRAWPGAYPAGKGAGLPALARQLGVELDHHDVMADVRLTHRVLMEASQARGVSPFGWPSLLERRAG